MVEIDVKHHPIHFLNFTFRCVFHFQTFIIYTVKPAHAVTSIKLSWHRNFISIELLLKGDLSYKANISLSQRYPFYTYLVAFHLSNYSISVCLLLERKLSCYCVVHLIHCQYHGFRRNVGRYFCFLYFIVKKCHQICKIRSIFPWKGCMAD